VPGADTLELAVCEAEIVGFTAEAARAYFRRERAEAPDNLTTAESVAESLHGSFTFLLARWE
jgi:hypothetical protein